LGTSSVAAKNFYHRVMQSTTVYMHELSKRRQSNPMSTDTLRSLEREYYDMLPRDVLLNALTIKMGARDSAILADCYGFMTRQNKPDTHICLDLSAAVSTRAREIVTPLHGPPNFTTIQNELCALLRRPAATVSFVDYLWPLRLGLTLEEKCIKTRVIQGKPQLYIAPVVDFEQASFSHQDSHIPSSFFGATVYSSDLGSSPFYPGKPLAMHTADF
jgi:hypothetical protein